MNFGLQLYSVRDKLSEDFFGTLKKLAEIGYRAFEFAGYYDHTAEEIRNFLDDLGLKAISSHVPLQLLEEKADREFEFAKRLNMEYVVCPALPKEKREDLRYYRKVADFFNRLGEKAKNYGLKFGYHNHDFEFKSLEGNTTGFDILIENTDPSLVFFEPDIYWIKYAGYDPVKFIEDKLKGRIFVVHLKDMKDNETKEMTELGTGIIDLKKIIEITQNFGTEWYIIEQDRSSLDSLESVKVSFDFLKNFGK
ncbi:MAG TPA: sugar phosphate isomerase/epimerase [Thermotogaceae bacterium]|nr:sugar phosphate isomerase/epimerase [Thermotogaceae bacterium]